MTIMYDDHECWWTRRRESEIRDHGSSLSGAGVPTGVLKEAPAVLGTAWSERPAADDEYGARIAIGAVTGSTHDGCFFQLTPASTAVKEAVVRAALRLHGAYLGDPINERAVLPIVLEEFSTGRTIRLRTDSRRRHLTIRTYPSGAGWLARLRARRVRVDCSSTRELSA